MVAVTVSCTVRISCTVWMVFDIRFSKANLHRHFQINQQVIMQTSHLWLLSSLFLPNVESLLSHSSNDSGTCSSRFKPSVPNQTCRDQLQPNIRCSLFSISSQVEQRGEIGIPIRTKLDLTSMALDTSFHVTMDLTAMALDESSCKFYNIGCNTKLISSV